MNNENRIGYDPEIYDPTKVCSDVLENLKYLATIDKKLNADGRLRPDQVQNLRNIVQIDRTDHARHKASLERMLGLAGS